MLSYCLNRRKKAESKNPKAVKTKKESQWFYQKLQYVTVKSYVSLIFFVNEHGLLLWKTKNVLQTLILFKHFYLSLIGNQTKMGK